MLGHSSIRLTVDLYGRWLPMANKAAMDRLDEGSAGRKFGPSGSRMVANGSSGGKAPETPGFTRGRTGQPPKSFLSDSRKPPTRGPCSSPDETRWYSSSSSRCLPVSLRGTSTTTL